MEVTYYRMACGNISFSFLVDLREPIRRGRFGFHIYNDFIRVGWRLGFR